MPTLRRTLLFAACLSLGGLMAAPMAHAQWVHVRPAVTSRLAPRVVQPRVSTQWTSVRHLGIPSQTQLHPPIPQPEPLEPGHVTCQVRSNTLIANGLMEVRLQGRVIATGRCGSPLEVPGGRYDVTLTLMDAMDRPQRTVPVTVPVDGTAHASTRFATAQLWVGISKDRRPVRGNTLIYRDGVRLGSMASMSPVTLSAGRYELLTRHRTETKTFHVDLTAGATRGLRAMF